MGRTGFCYCAFDISCISFTHTRFLEVSEASTCVNVQLGTVVISSAPQMSRANIDWHMDKQLSYAHSKHYAHKIL